MTGNGAKDIDMSRSINSFINIGIFAFLLSLGGCASSAIIQSNKLPTYSQIASRILIIGDLNVSPNGPMFDFDRKEFVASLGNSFTDCGTVVEYHEKNRLSLVDDIGQDVKNFGPDVILTIQWRSAELHSRGPSHLVYELVLTDIKTKTAVWKAEVNFTRAWHAGLVLAGSVISKLKADGLVADTCKAPKLT